MPPTRAVARVTAVLTCAGLAAVMSACGGTGATAGPQQRAAAAFLGQVVAALQFFQFLLQIHSGIIVAGRQAVVGKGMNGIRGAENPGGWGETQAPSTTQQCYRAAAALGTTEWVNG